MENKRLNDILADDSSLNNSVNSLNKGALQPRHKNYVRRTAIALAAAGTLYCLAVVAEHNHTYSRDDKGHLKPLTSITSDELIASAKTVNYELVDFVKHPLRAFTYD
jgi:hypothetical protein